MSGRITLDRGDRAPMKRWRQIPQHGVASVQSECEWVVCQSCSKVGPGSHHWPRHRHFRRSPWRGCMMSGADTRTDASVLAAVGRRNVARVNIIETKRSNARPIVPGKPSMPSGYLCHSRCSLDERHVETSTDLGLRRLAGAGLQPGGEPRQVSREMRDPGGLLPWIWESTCRCARASAGRSSANTDRSGKTKVSCPAPDTLRSDAPPQASCNAHKFAWPVWRLRAWSRVCNLPK